MVETSISTSIKSTSCISFINCFCLLLNDSSISAIASKSEFLYLFLFLFMPASLEDSFIICSIMQCLNA